MKKYAKLSIINFLVLLSLLIILMPIPVSAGKVNLDTYNDKQIISVPGLNSTSVNDPSYIVKTGTEANSTAQVSQRKLVKDTNGNLHMVYDRMDSQGVLQIYHAQSSDAGTTWTEEQVTNAATDQCFPSLAIDSQNNLHLVWQDGLTGQHNQGNVQVWYRMKTISWGASQLLSTYAAYASIAVDSFDNVHVVYGTYSDYGSYNDFGYGIRWREKTQAGWQGEVSISSSKAWVRVPSIAIDGNNYVHVVWINTPNQYYDVHYIKRTSFGWGSEVNITQNSYSGSASIAVDSANNIHIVWTEHVNNQYFIRYREITDSLQPTIDLEGPTTYLQDVPTISVDSQNHLNVLWSGLSEVSPFIQQIKSRAHTGSWQPEVDVTSSPTNDQNYPNSMWSFYPVISGVKTNVPQNGYDFVWMDWTTIKYSTTSGLEPINDTYPPIVNNFISDRTIITLGDTIRFSYSVSDTGGSGLKQVELWEATDTDDPPDGQPNWPQGNTDYVDIQTLSGDTATGSFDYIPSSAGYHWYGIHVLDNAGNINYETNSETGNLPGIFGPIEVTIYEQPQSVIPFLEFPLSCYTPLNVPINSVFDHHMETQYIPDDLIEAYTGETGDKQYGAKFVTNYGGNDLYGFKKDADGSIFSINGNYNDNYLYYDGHPGYDFQTTEYEPDGQINVLAGADGIAYLGNENIGKIQIDHGNGYRTNYIHLSQRNIADGQTVYKGQIIGVSGDIGAEGNPHLHFSVEKKVGNAWIPVDPYGWQGIGVDPYTVLTGIENVNLWLDSTPPDTQIINGFSGVVLENSITIEWTGSDDVTPVSELEYSYLLDNNPIGWSQWLSYPFTSTVLSDLPDGEHVFKVKARDKAGNEDPTPAEMRFTTRVFGYSFGNNKVDRLSDESKKTILSKAFDLSGVSSETQDAAIDTIDEVSGFGDKAVCFGMALSSIMEYSYPGYDTFLEDQELSYLHSVPEPERCPWYWLSPNYWDGSGDISERPALEHILKFYIMQNASLQGSQGTDQVLRTLMNDSSSDTYVLGILDSPDSNGERSGHAIVPLDLQTISQDAEYRVQVYDPNRPDGVNQAVIFMKESSGKWTWKFLMGDGDEWSGPTASDYPVDESIVLISVNGIYNNGNRLRWPGTGSAWPGLCTVQGASGVMLIDSAGRRMGFDGDSIIEEIPDIDMVYPLVFLPDEPDQGHLPFFQFSSDMGLTYIIKGNNPEGENISFRKFGQGYFITFNSFVKNTQTSITISEDGTNLLIHGQDTPYTLTAHNGELAQTFSANAIPVTRSAIHQYSIDWDTLAQGQQGVTVQIDENGDGTFERTIKTGKTLTGDELIPPVPSLSLFGMGFLIALFVFGILGLSKKRGKVK